MPYGYFDSLLKRNPGREFLYIKKVFQNVVSLSLSVGKFNFAKTSLKGQCHEKSVQTETVGS